MGAWIETAKVYVNRYGGTVAPHVGAWIETGMQNMFLVADVGRTPRGCVD